MLMGGLVFMVLLWAILHGSGDLCAVDSFEMIQAATPAQQTCIPAHLSSLR